VEGSKAKTLEQEALHPEQNKNTALKEQPWAQENGRKNQELYAIISTAAEGQANAIHFLNKNVQSQKQIKNGRDCGPILDRNELFDTRQRRVWKTQLAKDSIDTPSHRKGQEEQIGHSVFQASETERRSSPMIDQKFVYGQIDRPPGRWTMQCQTIQLDRPTPLSIQAEGGTTAPPEINIFIPSPTDTSIR